MEFTNNDPLLTVKEAALVIGVAAGTLDQYRATGRYKIPFVTVRGRIMYHRSDLNKYLAARIVELAKPKPRPGTRVVPMKTALAKRPRSTASARSEEIFNEDGSLIWKNDE